MSCSSSVQPLALTWVNNTVSPDGRAINDGIGVLVGTPGQTLSLTPALSINNTAINSISICGTGSAASSNDSCISPLGGVYDSSKSSSFSPSVVGSWNGSSEDDSSVLFNSNWQFLNDKLQTGKVDLPDFPLLLSSDSYSFGILGIGQNSTFISSLVAQNLAPSNSFSLYTGQYSALRAGSLVIGGYSDEFHDGPMHHGEVFSPACTACVNITSLKWSPTSGQAVELLANRTSGNRWLIGVIETAEPFFGLPTDITNHLSNVTNSIGRGVVNVLSYPPSALPQGDIVVTLANGLQTTVKHEALFGPTVYTNHLLDDYANDTSGFSAITDTAQFVKADGADNIALLGIPYASFVYIIRDYERNNFSIGNAANITGTSFPSDFTAICPTSSNGSGSGHHSHAGAIAGGVVGGVVGVALLLALAWWFTRRRKRQTPPAPKSAAVEAPIQAEHKDPDTALTSDTDGTVTASSEIYSHEKPRAELSPDNLVKEMSGKDAKTELPTGNETPRAELPA